MKRKGSIRFFWSGVIILFLVGSLITPIKKATATSIRGQQDIGEINVSPTLGLVTTEAGGTDTFSVVLGSQPTADVIIGLSSSDPAEGTVSPTSLTFTIDNWSTLQTVIVTGVDDQVDDGNIVYTLATAAATSSDPTYDGINAADVSATNQDNDIAGISVTPTSGLSTNEGGGSAPFTVELTSQPTANVTIGVSSSDTTEGTVSPTSLTFTIGNWSNPQSVTVTGVNDQIADGGIAYQVITAPATSSDLTYNGINAADVSLFNQDNDTAGTTVNQTSGLTTTEAGGTATFTVELNTQPSANVTIGLSSSDTTEATVQPNSLTFTSGNWSTTQTVTVTGVNDLIDDGDQAFTINTGAAVSSDPFYNGLIVLNVTGINTNDDFTPVAVTDSFVSNTQPGKPLTINPPGILGNDTDANNDSITAVIKVNPLKGTLGLNPNGSFVYTPIQIFSAVETDSFTYAATDGFLESNPTTVSITIDPINPVVNWVGPVQNGKILKVNDQLVQLQANATDNYSIDRVRFFRWDAINNMYVDIGVVTNSPFEWILDTSALNYQWNQVFVSVKDLAGNTAIQFIWIFKNLPIRNFMPTIMR